MRMHCSKRMSHLLMGNELSMPERIEINGSEGLYGAFCIVTWMYVWWGEFNCTAIVTHGGFEFPWCLIVKNVPIDMNDLRVFPALVDGLVGLDEVSGLE